MNTSVFNIAIIGLGPKGLYGLERLLACIRSTTVQREVHIHLFNESRSFGAGWVYKTDQPEYLLMNYTNRYISVVPEQAPEPACDLVSFSQWRSNKTGKTVEDENKKVSPRKEVGNYLAETFERICEAAPENVFIHKHIAAVSQIKKENATFKIQIEDGAFNNIAFDQVLITTGHKPAIVHRANSNVDPSYIPFIYPVDDKLKCISPQNKVICKGIGLTAIDTILGLTEGKGGHFIMSKNGNLTYHPSGQEPEKIFPFSRSGVPIIPRGEYTDHLQQSSFYLKTFVENIDPAEETLDFELHTLPLIYQDIQASFYRQLFKNYAYKVATDLPYDELEKYISKFHKQHPDAPYFIAKDFVMNSLPASSDHHQEVKKHWQFWVEENEKPDSPFVAAACAWRFIAADFNTIYSNNWLSPKSLLNFQQQWFGRFNRIAYGPPLVNIRKMLALMDAGIVDFAYARSPEIEESDSLKEIKCNGISTTFDHHINATLPRAIDKNAKSIFTNSADLFSFQNKKDALSELHCTRSGNPINPNGEIEKNITLYGTPTEGQLFDNDSLSRKANDTISDWAKAIANELKTLIPA